MLSTYAKNAITLGLLAAIGPFAIDMYLPALPAIASDLGATTAATQMTLMTFFVAFGLCQMVYGPISDMAGRKPPLFFGLTFFAIGSIGCAVAPTVEWLLAFRFVQGIGASSFMVIPRAIIRDLHTGVEATRLMSTVMLVLSVSPILAPLIGSALIVPFGWRAVFAVVTVIALLGFALVAFVLPETRPAADRIGVSFRNAFAGFRELLCHPRFLGLTFIGAFCMGGFFAFLAGSSFVYMDHFGISPGAYGLAFSLNAVGFIGTSQFAARLGQAFGMVRVVTVALILHTLLTVALVGMTWLGVDILAVLIAMLFAAFACQGLVIPVTMVLALEEHGPIAGMASALGGTLQMVSGGLMIVVISLFFDGTVAPMVTAIALCAIGALVLCLVTFRGEERAAGAPG